jgi:integrase
MKRPTLKVLAYKHSETHRFLLDLRPWGKGRMFFKTRAEADAERLRQLNALKRHGEEAIGLPAHELSEFIKARKRLADHGKTITNAADFLIHHLEQVRRCNTTISELTAELIAAKRRDGRSKVYINDLKQRLNRFCQDFGDRPVASIIVDEIDRWIRDLPFSPQGRANYRTILGTLFSHAVRRRMLDSNPALHTEKPKLVDKAPEIFSVDELRALLEAARNAEPSVVPMLAIGGFAGLRDAEIKRLHWNEVKLQRGHIEVTAAKAKSARRRLVPIQPNLAGWLQPHAVATGNVVPQGARRKLARVRKEAGLVSWPKNGLRHSFASYRLATTNNAPAVAAELGHSTPAMLYANYRELVLPEEADLYWKIAPATEAENVVAFASAGDPQ